jgi:hypothetical protein
VTGAYILSNIDGNIAKPFVMAYLTAIGLYLLWRAWRMNYGHEHKSARVVEPLGLIGGFLDAVGGGGWGPVVTSNLLVQGTEPRTTIGTVNASEFVLTATVSITFILTLGFKAFTVATIGLIIGGLLAAPFAACGEDADSDAAPATGTLNVRIWGEEYIEDTIPAETFADGWSVRFDKFLLRVGSVRVGAATGTPSLTTGTTYRVYDLAVPPTTAGDAPGHLVAAAEVDAGHCDAEPECRLG